VLTSQANLARTRGDLPRTIELSRRALDCLPETDLIDRSLLALNLGLAYWHTGQNDAAEKALSEAQQAAQACGNTYAQLTATIFLGRVHSVRGELRQAAAIYRTAIQKGGQVPMLAIAHLDLAALHYEWNELEACRAELMLALESNRFGGNAEVQAAIYLMLARLESATGNIPAMQAVFNSLHQLEEAANLSVQVRQRNLDGEVELALRGGDLKTASSLIEQADPELDAHPFYRFLGLTRARLAIALGQREAASQFLNDSYNRAERNGWGYGVIAVRLLQALAGETQKAALAFLTDALQRSQPDGFLRIYADSGRELIPLLQEAARCGVQPLYVGEILTVIGDQASPRAGMLIESESGLVEALSPRELEVLRLMAAGLSNREIADRLVVSAGTVKTHVHHICGKLGVANRTQAVIRARDLHLI
jgi:LuxR family maltose regulon positive regulatory protein